MSSHFHSFALSNRKRFVLFYEATKKVQQEVGGIWWIYWSGGEKNDGKTLMETDPGSTIEKEQYPQYLANKKQYLSTRNSIIY